MRMMAKGEPFMEVEADDCDLPVFCESFLYPRVGKGDARFILAVAREYETLIKLLGTEKIKEMLLEAKKKGIEVY